MAATDKDEAAQKEAEQAFRAAELKKGKAKIRTIRIWLWVIAGLFAALFFLSQCAMSKPKAKSAIIESCVKNVPFTEKWQADLNAAGLGGKSDEVIQDYCLCMWNEPLDKLTDKQIHSMSSMDARKQLELLGGVEAFNRRDAQCIAGLKTK
ncbi:MAG: hypothetical protein Q4A84_01535 [Neisseria sp.]|uniref:hypothetical protein n=1 Tax=Neisseria sp. TaxID=192066 RepID=UPI0026DD3819|nr:hypothetical protein [Neisseria sp.]MDO4640372.1 hypothetical protein [Neisseria sp.]